LEAIGFKCIPLNKDPGRLGACLRVMLINYLHGKTIFVHSGRPGLHVLASEFVANKVEHRTNTVIGPWSTPSPFLDGYVNTDGLSWHNQFALMSTGHFYHEIYGIDEACFSRLEISKLIFSRQKGVPYSTNGLTTENMQRLDNLLLDDIEPLLDGFAVPLPIIVKSAKDVNSTWDLVRSIDPMIGSNSREFQPNSDELQGKIKSTGAMFFITGIPSTKAIPTFFKLTNMDLERVVFNPQVVVGCSSATILEAVKEDQRAVVKDKLDHYFNLESLASIEDIRCALHCLQINYHIHTRSENIGCIFHEDQPIHFYRILPQDTGYLHMIEVSYINPTMESVIDKLAVKLKDETSIDPINYGKLETGGVPITIDDDLKQALITRLQGRLDIILSREGRPIPTNHVSTATSILTSHYIEPGYVYCLTDGVDFKPTICTLYDGRPVVKYVEGTDPTMLFPTKIKVDEHLVKKIRSERAESVPTLGLVTLQDASWVAKHKPELSNIFRNHSAKKLLVFNYDGVNHHNSPDFLTLSNRFTDIVSSDLMPEDWMPLLAYDGVVRLNIHGGRPVLRCHTYDQELDDAVNKCLTKSVTINVAEDILKRFKNYDTVRSGNRPSLVRHRVFPTDYQTSSQSGMTIRADLAASFIEAPTWLDDDTQYYVTTSLISFIGDSEYAWHDTTLSHEPSCFDYNIIVVGFGDDPENILIEAMPGDNIKHVFDLHRKDLSSSKQYEPNEDEIKQLMSIDCLVDTTDARWVTPVTGTYSDHGRFDLIVGPNSSSGPELIPSTKLVRPEIINYWEDNTGMMVPTIPLPNDYIKLTIKNNMAGVKSIRKDFMVKYPSHGQSAQTKRFMADTQAVSDLFGKKLVLRKYQHSPVEDAKSFMNLYCDRAKISGLPTATLDFRATIEWLKERPGPQSILNEIIEVLTLGLELGKIHNVNVHMKLESRMKDVAATLESAIGMPETLDEQRVRLIVWQRKGITAIFAPMFKQIKDNLKYCLLPKYKYTDGLTPQQLNAILNHITEPVVFIEDDCKKQDRQTDNILLDTEMEIYKQLGGNPVIVDLWRTVHRNWRAKGMNVSFVGDAARHTGQATTAIGNVIVNLLIRDRLVRKLGSNLILLLCLGDDNLLISKVALTPQEIKKGSALHYNMVSEPVVSEIVGGYLRMLVYRNRNGMLECSPDFVRLERKHEVLNGVSEASDINIRARNLSYLFMLGGLPGVAEAVKANGFELDVPLWYNGQDAMTVCAEKYSTTISDVEAHAARLIKNCSTTTTFQNQQLMWVAKKV